MKDVGLLSSLSMQAVSTSGRKTARHLAGLRKAAPKAVFPETTVLKAIVLNPAIKSGIAQSGITDPAPPSATLVAKVRSPDRVSRPSLPGCKSAFAARCAQSVVMTRARRRPAAIGDTIASEPGLHLGAMGGERTAPRKRSAALDQPRLAIGAVCLKLTFE